MDYSKERVIQIFENEQEYDLTDLVSLGIIVIEAETWIGRSDIELENYIGKTLVAAVVDTFPSTNRLGLAARSLGINLVMVAGYPGSADAIGAISRGEVDIAAFSTTSVIRASNNELLKPLVVLDEKPHPDLPGIPHLAGYDGIVEQFSQQLTEEQRLQAHQFAQTTVDFSDSIRGLFASTNLPDQSKQCLIAVVEKVLFSKELESVAALARRPISPMNSEQSTELFEESFNAANEFRPLFTSILSEALK